MKAEYERMLDRSKEEQLKQLKANENKGGWDNLSIEDIVFAIGHNLSAISWANSPTEIKRRLANVANFAGMGIDILW